MWYKRERRNTIRLRSIALLGPCQICQEQFLLEALFSDAAAVPPPVTDRLFSPSVRRASAPRRHGSVHTPAVANPSHSSKHKELPQIRLSV
ncbi:uncharacterized [Tachysurus ichikawai]